MADKSLRLLVGIDFSRASEKALANARSLLSRTRGTLVIAHARPVSDLRAAVVEELGALIRSSPPGGLKRAIQQHYEKKLSRMIRGPNESALVLKGEPAWALAKEAARGYDYLLIATRGRGAATSLLLGGTARAVVWHARTPVIVVPAKR